MNSSSLRFLAYTGILITLILSIWYTLRTYQEGNPKWIYLIMTFAISILLSLNLFKSGRRKD